MSGAEIAVPIVVFCMKLFVDFGIRQIDSNSDAQAFIMMEKNVADDVKDAYMFLNMLRRYVGKEEELKERALAAIVKTEEALELFRERMGNEGARGTLGFVLSNRKAARSLLQPLQLAQSNLARRIDWMRSALERLADSTDEEGELPSSMAPGVHDG